MDSDIEDGMMYFYRIRAADYSGNWSDYSEVVQLSTLSNDNANVAERFVLHQNYPNPFNPRTNVRYDLPEEAFVDITVYDMFGNTVKTLVDEKMSSGFKSVQWNAKNNQGQPVSAGVYVYTTAAREILDRQPDDTIEIVFPTFTVKILIHWWSFLFVG